MDTWTTYLVGGGGLALMAGLIWKLLALMVKGVQEENVRLSARVEVLDKDNTIMWERTRAAEESVSGMVVTNNEAAARLASALDSNARQAAELAAALTNITVLTARVLELTTGGGR